MAKKAKMYKDIAFKIDLYVTTNQTVCANNNLTSPCIMITHDAPGLQRKYDDWESALNTMQQLSLLYPDNFFTVALCSKAKIGKCDEQFLQVNDYVFKRIEDFNLKNFEFVLDGALEPTESCLYKRYLPWNSTFTFPRDPIEAITSDNEELGYNRYQVLNVETGFAKAEENLKAIADQYGWGKFPQNKYWYQIWEPFDEDDVLSVVEFYKSSNQTKTLFITNNLDPLHMQLYYSSKNSEQVTKLYKIQETLKFTLYDNNSILIINTKTQFTLVLWTNSSEGDYYHYWSAKNPWSEEPLYTGIIETYQLIESAFYVESQNKLWILNLKNHIVRYDVDENTGFVNLSQEFLQQTSQQLHLEFPERPYFANQPSELLNGRKNEGKICLNSEQCIALTQEQIDGQVKQIQFSYECKLIALVTGDNKIWITSFKKFTF